MKYIPYACFNRAASFRNVEVAKILLAYGCPVNILNADGQTALHISCKCADVNFIALLLDEGADISIMDGKGVLAKTLVPSSNEVITNMLEGDLNPSYTYSKNNIHISAHSVVPVEGAYDSSIDGSVVGQSPSTDLASTIDDRRNVDEDNWGDIDELTGSFEKEDALLVLWPPTQRQRRMQHNAVPLTFSSSEIIYVYIDDDLESLLPGSGLMDCLQNFGIQAQVTKSSNLAKIRLSIDPNTCPGRHRYEIIVGSDLALLTASDLTSMLYAIYTFIQLTTLHSEVKSETSGTIVEIPSIYINDWPDVENRAVLWYAS